YRFFAHRSFAVIRQWTMPAILTEGDFVSNYSIEVWQKSGDFSTKNAEAIFMAIKEFVETFGFLD
ncbi:MAG TPA: N-acetylmuramoyl-L-alanine amidase, partial [Bacillota bacterium]|nr:N-acetylmuramoyl-L-alanine amidase [Bacillota bacterium]